ncbi:MAG: 16S rRNA (cytidine(1402)-2'-O)-methyltransferase [bacterium]|nr:16S rRNA (cytidine(1402)-2'-O)-methyltransferase [bacterium]
MSAKLSIIGTPIGNLEDITLRALETLRACDVLFCEDTRQTAKLLARYEISGTPLHRLDQHAQQRTMDAVFDALRVGKHVAFVTDAGTPGVSDPGGILVARVAEFLPDVHIEPIPGASALTTLASVTGFPTDRFLFLGFLPLKSGRKAILERIAQSEETVFFYESPHRIVKTLTALLPLLGTRPIVVGRELTKKFETIYRGTARDVLDALTRGSNKGEFVIGIAGARRASSSRSSV